MIKRAIGGMFNKYSVLYSDGFSKGSLNLAL